MDSSYYLATKINSNLTVKKIHIEKTIKYLMEIFDTEENIAEERLIKLEKEMKYNIF